MDALPWPTYAIETEKKQIPDILHFEAEDISVLFFVPQPGGRVPHLGSLISIEEVGIITADTCIYTFLICL